MARHKDLHTKANDRRTVASAKTKEPPSRLSDLVREEAKSLEEGRLESTVSPPDEASIERAAIERKRVSDHPDLKHLYVPDHAFQRAVNTMQGILQVVKVNDSFSFHSVKETADYLLPSLTETDTLLAHIFTGNDSSLDPAREAVNVCILAVKFGIELGHARDELRQLSLAALVHDVGMARLPEGLVEKNGLLNPGERASLARHSEEGARIIRALGHEYTWLGDVIIQVHERVDGSGYPKALKGTDVHEYAQIIGLADVYESLVHHRPYRRRLSPLDALKEILNRERTAFPDRILKALIQALSPYPVGSLVRLNTGEIARVVAKDKDHPLRPVLEIIVRGGKRLEETVVTDLSQSPLLNVQESVVEEDLP